MNINEIIQKGGARQVLFAITNLCNAKCGFCGFNTTHCFPRKNLGLAEGLKAIDFLAEQNVRILSLTGGEPLLNPNLEQFVAHSTRCSIMTRTGTNGIALDERRLEGLKKAGISSMWFSIDSDVPEIHDKNRGKEGLFKHIVKLREFGESIGIQLGAGVAISRLIKDYDNLFKLLEETGFKSVTFAYPSGTMNSSYLATTSDEISSYTDDELAAIITKIIAFKEKRRNLKIGNSMVALKLMYNKLAYGRPMPRCYAGSKIFYLDWDLNLHRCFTMKPYGHLFEHPLDSIENDECDLCYSQCFRDYSLFYPVLENETLLSSLMAWQELIADNNLLGVEHLNG